MRSVIRTILLFLCFGLANSSWSQSTFVFGNPPSAPVFDAVGQRLFGTDYSALLYGGASPDSLVRPRNLERNELLAPAPFTRLLNGEAGYFFGGFAIFLEPDTIPMFVQVRAWDNRLGATYEDAVARGIGGYGESPLLQLRGGCGVCTPIGQASTLIGLQSFSLSPVVPEPSSAWLLLLGVPWLAWRCRRK